MCQNVDLGVAHEEKGGLSVPFPPLSNPCLRKGRGYRGTGVERPSPESGVKTKGPTPPRPVSLRTGRSTTG